MRNISQQACREKTRDAPGELPQSSPDADGEISKALDELGARTEAEHDTGIVGGGVAAAAPPRFTEQVGRGEV
jgi:hypothetical protein